MKHFIPLFFLFAVVLNSCTKQEIPEPERNQLDFSKEMSFTDNSGNSIQATIYATSRSNLDFVSNETFALKVFTEKTSQFYNLNNPKSSVLPDDSRSGISNPNDFYTGLKIYIQANELDFISEAVSYRIEPTFAILGSDENNINNRQNWGILDEIGYGSSGINGVAVDYVLESQPQEYVKIRLSKKTSRYNWFWQRLAQDYLYSQGSHFNYYGGTEWELFRLRMWIYETSGEVNTCWGNPNNWCFIVDWEWLL